LEGGEVVALGTLDEVRQSKHPFVQQFFARRADAEGGDTEDYLRSLTGESTVDTENL